MTEHPAKRLRQRKLIQESAEGITRFRPTAKNTQQATDGSTADTSGGNSGGGSDSRDGDRK